MDYICRTGTSQMIRLFIIAAVLCATAVSVLAQFAPTPTLLSGNVASGGGVSGTACDYGPNAVLPTPASKAGFTHCFLNADFTTNTTDSNGINWSNPNTWAANCGANFNAMFFLTLHNDQTNFHNSAPCNRAIMTTDVGTQVFLLEFTTTDVSNGYDLITLNWPTGFDGLGCSTQPGCPAGGPNKTGLGRAVYAQIKFRTTADSWAHLTGAASILYDFWEDACNCGPNNTAFIEVDYFEMYSGGGGSGCGTPTSCTTSGTIKVGSFPTNLFGPFDATQYHTYGELLTIDNTNNTNALCQYLDSGITSGTPTPSPCANTNSLTTASINLLLMNLSTWTGALGNGGTGSTTANIDMFIQSIQLWSCSNAWNATCITHPLVTSEVRNNKSWVAELWDHLGLIREAHADPWDGPGMGLWVCPDGNISSYAQLCMPDTLKVGNWWDSCVPNRSDCVWSETAIRGWVGNRVKPRGPGYCYTQQPYTCSPDGKVP